MYQIGDIMRTFFSMSKQIQRILKITSAPPDMTAQDFQAWMDIDENLETFTASTGYDICEVV